MLNKLRITECVSDYMNGTKQYVLKAPLDDHRLSQLVGMVEDFENEKECPFEAFIQVKIGNKVLVKPEWSDSFFETEIITVCSDDTFMDGGTNFYLLKDYNITWKSIE